MHEPPNLSSNIEWICKLAAKISVDLEFGREWILHEHGDGHAAVLGLLMTARGGLHLASTV
jgi:hypothetical protein